VARNKYGGKPLHNAAKWGTPANIQVLLDAGADVMARMVNGDTSLHEAARCFNCEPRRITTLLDAGADGKAKSKNGETPWDLAQENEKLKGTADYWALNDARYN
jgi:ankyrin repeat protein